MSASIRTGVPKLRAIVYMLKPTPHAKASYIESVVENARQHAANL
jgi:hypothetical protein